ncbi:MAG: ankyrin repeat domain-containing protein, partial [Bacteroidota bacterium]
MNTVFLRAMANILKSGIPGFFVPLSLLLMGSPLFSQSIYRTACNGNLSRLDSLLQTTSINTLDNRGRTLLHWAVACNQEKVLHVLMKQGIKTGVEDQEGMTPLHVAVQFARKNLFDTLVRLQKDSSWIVRYGPAMMEKALLRKKLPMVQKLTENGVDINQANDRGSVPLEIAQRMGLDTIADFLLRMGADESKVRHFQPKGRYMGQEKPGMEPQLFAPNFISTEESEFGSVFSKDNQEFFYAVDVNGKAEIRYSKRIDDQWTPPKILLSHERYGYNDPFLSPDENRLYFISKRAMDGVSDPKDVDIWFVE